MPGPVYKESWSRCEPPSMLYDTIRNPNAPYIPPKPPQINSPDTIESTQQRLNREVFEKFKVNARLTHDSFVTVVQVGKYVFMAVMLPPYLCIYGIPKWFFINALPQMFLVIKMQSMNIGRFMQELTKRVKDLMKGMMDQLIGDALKMAGRHTRKFMQMMGHGFDKAHQVLAQAMAKVKEHLNSFHQACLRPFKVMHEKSSKALTASAKWLEEKGENIKNSVQRSCSHAAKAVQNNLLTPVWNALTIPYHQVRDKLNDIAGRFNKMNNTLKSKLESVKDVFSNAGQAVIEQLKKVLDKVELGLNWTQSHVEKASEALRKLVDRGVGTVADIAQKVNDKIHDFAAPKLERIVQHFQQMSNVVVQAGYIMLGWVSKPIKRGFKSFRSGKEDAPGVMRRLAEGFRNGVVGLVQEVNKRVKSWWKLFLQAVAAFRAWLRQQLIDLPGKALIAFKHLWQRLKYMGTRGLLGTRLFIAWMWLIATHGMQLVRELAEELDRWFATKV